VSAPSSIPITRPSVGQEEADAAAAAVLSGWLSQGQRVQEFERIVADYVGISHAIATTNCTTALHLALVVAGVGPGDEVICPSFTFIASANAIRHAGGTPVFVDIDPRTYNIDPALVQRAITSRTKAILPVDQIGLAADIDAIRAIATRSGLTVVEDAAPALGARIGEARVGALSHFTCFSFHPRKSITTGEGGMITTDDDDAADRLKRIRSHAASTSDLWRFQSASTDMEVYPEIGYNCRLSDIHAAVGVVQMRKLDAILRRRRQLAERYNHLLSDDDRVETPYEPPGYVHTYQSYCIRLRSGGGIARRAIMDLLASQGIATRKGVMASHLEPCYRALARDLSLPVTERAAEETMLLPLYADMTEAQQDRVVSALRQAIP
jgi:perosamine synthetase